MIVALLALSFGSLPTNLVSNPSFDLAADHKTPDGYVLTGKAAWVWTGYADEIVTPGIALSAYGADGSVSQMVRNIDPQKGKWIRFSFRGLPEDNFAVGKDRLYMKIDFYSKSGTNYQDSAERLIYREVEKDRRDLTVNGDYGKGGAAVWRTYEFEELLPFAETDSIKITVGFANGASKTETKSSFFIDDFTLTQNSQSSRGSTDPADAKTPATGPEPSTDGMIRLGGRWYYRPLPSENVSADANGLLKGGLRVTEDNAARLFYRDDRLVNPFAANMGAWLRKGYLDLNGNLVTKDRYVPDNVTLTFNGGQTLVVRARNIPNHPTAKFPDTYGTQGYNPSYIQEHDYTYYLPLEPARNPQAISMTAHDENGALPMGSVGFAVNGVVFYNPFDAGMQDASSIMDRCCGHPSPDNRYHYHKYPVCVNTPFVDKGESHSPVIGFAFDGFPVYGPYESKGVMARDATTNALNAFNVHYDAVRGWHYHVTPGKFPYIVGGYFGKVDMRNFQRGPRP